MDKKNENIIQKVEEMMKQHKLINSTETIYDFLKKPHPRAVTIIDKYFKESKDEFKPIPNVQNNRIFIHIILLISFSNAFYEIQHSKNTAAIKLNASKLRKVISKMVIEDLSPYIMGFLKWDLDRRVWKSNEDEYKIQYLKEVANDLDNELQGKNKLVKKYIKLFLEFIVAKYDEHILPHFSSEEFKKFKIDTEKLIEMRNQFEQWATSNTLDEIIDEKDESDFLETYIPHADSYIKGLRTMLSRFDYLLYAFIEAQNDYKKFIGGLLSSLEINKINEIKTTLENVDIAKFITILRAVFASVPNELVKNTTEAYYHVYLHIVLRLIGCEIRSEVSTNIGRIDAVIEFDKIIYIIEFKLSNATKALNQIKDKEYHDSFMHLNKTIYLLGIAFDSTQKNIRKEYMIEKIN